MRETISIAAIILAFVYFLAFAAAVFVALEEQMHWALAIGAFTAIILIRLWPLLPLLCWLGAHNVWHWPWWAAGLLAFPLCFYIASHYWVRLTDHFRRPAQQQGV